MSEDKDLQEKEMQGREASDGNTKEDEYEKSAFCVGDRRARQDR